MIDWDKWNLGWAAGLPKNQMWAKIRSGKNDKNGEPTFQYEGKADKSSLDGAMGSVLADHHFIAPAVESVVGADHCFCGWTGADHADHLQEQVARFCSAVTPAETEKPKKAAKKAAKDQADGEAEIRADEVVAVSDEADE